MAFAQSPFNPINQAPNGGSYLDHLANKYILKPRSVTGIGGFIFDYEGETNLQLQSEMKLTSKELSNTHRVIVFGESKSGKTGGSGGTSGGTSTNDNGGAGGSYGAGGGGCRGSNSGGAGGPGGMCIVTGKQIGRAHV